MAWRDTLREASFRGVPFYYDGVSSRVGRRAIIHKYPGRDDAEVEDLGKDAGEFDIDAWVIGPDYQEQRDQLVAAFTKAGAGELVHPYWGNRRVAAAGKIRFTESTREGGMCRISIPVVEVGKQLTPSVTADTKAKVATAADDAIGAAGDAFIDDSPAGVDGVGWNLDDAISSAVDGAQDAVDEAYTAFKDVKSNIDAALDLTDSVVTDIQKASETLDDIIGTPTDIAAKLTGFAYSVMSSISEVEDAVEDLIALGGDETLPYARGSTSQRFRSDVLMAAARVLDAFDADGATVLGEGTQATAEENAIDAVIRIVRVSSAVEAARAVSGLTFDSFDQAYAVLDELGDILEDLADTSTDDVEYRTLYDTRAALALHIQATAADLPRIVEYTPPETMPALVVAQRFYGDPDMAEDIIARNNVRNPQCVPGQVALEVLNDE